MISIAGHRLFIWRCVKGLGRCIYWLSYTPFPTDICEETLSDLGNNIAKIE
jgi:hypothetical protein